MKTTSHHSALIGIIAVVLSLALPGAQHALAQDVTVINPVTNPVNVQPPSDSQPFTATQFATDHPENGRALAIFNDLAPNGYRVIITHVSVFAGVEKNDRALANLRVYQGAGLGTEVVGRVVLPLVFQGRENVPLTFQIAPDIYVGNPSVDISVAPSQHVVVEVKKSGPGSIGAEVTLQGHYARIQTGRP